MKNVNIKQLMTELENENLNLVTNRSVVAGSDSGSWWTISIGSEGPTNWQGSFSDWWDNCVCKE
jgi:hypothetical protein